MIKAKMERAVRWARLSNAAARRWVESSRTDIRAFRVMVRALRKGAAFNHAVLEEMKASEPGRRTS